MTTRYPRMDGGASDVADVRVHNLLLVLHAIADHGPVARTTIAAQTGLSKSSLTGLTADLLARGLIRELDEEHTSRRGRPLSRLVVDGSADAVVAVQLRGEDLVVEACDLGGAPRYRAVTAHGCPLGDSAEMARRVAAAAVTARRALADDGATVRHLRLVIAAPVCGTPPMIPAAIDFGWNEPVDLARLVNDELSAALDGAERIPLDVENDASMAALAEREALAIPPHTMVYLKSNTGIGGAAFVHGQLLRGATGFAFEPGHVIVDPGGARCGCGQRGCLVTVAGPQVVLADAELTDIVAQDGIRATLRELTRRWVDGDPAASRAVGHLIERLVPVLQNIQALVEPERIILGGYWAGLVPALREYLDSHARELGWSARSILTTLHAASLGDGGAARGALLGARWAACAAAVSRPAH